MGNVLLWFLERPPPLHVPQAAFLGRRGSSARRRVARRFERAGGLWLRPKPGPVFIAKAAPAETPFPGYPRVDDGCRLGGHHRRIWKKYGKPTNFAENEKRVFAFSPLTKKKR